MHPISVCCFGATLKGRQPLLNPDRKRNCLKVVYMKFIYYLAAIGDSGLDSKDNITVGNDHVSQGRFANTILSVNSSLKFFFRAL